MFVYYSVIPGDAILFSDYDGPIDFIKGLGPLDHTKIRYQALTPSDCIWMIPGTEE